MSLSEVYVGLGGNIGDSCTILKQAVQHLALLPSIEDLEVSRYYSTTPVSSIPQAPYVNAVCRFKTKLTPRELLFQLQKIETNLGKKEKRKEAPRIIDLDILFYGQEVCNDWDLKIPHPHWKERLFVLAPLADLVSHLMIPDSSTCPRLKLFDVKEYLQAFPNIHQEKVTPLSEIIRSLCIQYNSENSLLVKNNP